MRITIRKAVLVVGFLAYVTDASAQSGAPATEKPLTLTVTVGELNVIGKALGKLPFEEVAQLMTKLQSQVTAQQGGASTGASAPPVPEPAKP